MEQPQEKPKERTKTQPIDIPYQGYGCAVSVKGRSLKGDIPSPSPPKNHCCNTTCYLGKKSK